MAEDEGVQQAGDQENGGHESLGQATDSDQDRRGQVVDGRFAEVASSASNEQDEESDLHRRNLEMLYEIPVTVSVRLGETEMSIRELLDLRSNSVIELEKVADEDVDLLINGLPVGKGDVVVVNDKFGLRINEITPIEERLKKI